MNRKEITTKEDLYKVIELLEKTGITYWLDGGWGVDILAGKQTRIFRNHNKIILIALQELKYHAHLYLLIHNLNEKLFALLMIYTEFFSLQKRQN